MSWEVAAPTVSSRRDPTSNLGALVFARLGTASVTLRFDSKYELGAHFCHPHLESTQLDGLYPTTEGSRRQDFGYFEGQGMVNQTLHAAIRTA